MSRRKKVAKMTLFGILTVLYTYIVDRDATHSNDDVCSVF